MLTYIQQQVISIYPHYIVCHIVPFKLLSFTVTPDYAYYITSARWCWRGLKMVPRSDLD